MSRNGSMGALVAQNKRSNSAGRSSGAAAGRPEDEPLFTVLGSRSGLVSKAQSSRDALKTAASKAGSNGKLSPMYVLDGQGAGAGGVLSSPYSEPLLKVNGLNKRPGGSAATGAGAGAGALSRPLSAKDFITANQLQAAALAAKQRPNSAPLTMYAASGKSGPAVGGSGVGAAAASFGASAALQESPSQQRLASGSSSGPGSTGVGASKAQPLSPYLRSGPGGTAATASTSGGLGSTPQRGNVTRSLSSPAGRAVGSGPVGKGSYANSTPSFDVGPGSLLGSGPAGGHGTGEVLSRLFEHIASAGSRAPGTGQRPVSGGSTGLSRQSPRAERAGLARANTAPQLSGGYSSGANSLRTAASVPSNEMVVSRPRPVASAVQGQVATSGVTPITLSSFDAAYSGAGSNNAPASFAVVQARLMEAATELSSSGTGLHQAGGLIGRYQQSKSPAVQQQQQQQLQQQRAQLSEDPEPSFSFDTAVQNSRRLDSRVPEQPEPSVSPLRSHGSAREDVVGRAADGEALHVPPTHEHASSYRNLTLDLSVIRSTDMRISVLSKPRPGTTGTPGSQPTSRQAWPQAQVQAKRAPLTVSSDLPPNMPHPSVQPMHDLLVEVSELESCLGITSRWLGELMSLPPAQLLRSSGSWGGASGA